MGGQLSRLDGYKMDRPSGLPEPYKTIDDSRKTTPRTSQYPLVTTEGKSYCPSGIPTEVTSRPARPPRSDAECTTGLHAQTQSSARARLTTARLRIFEQMERHSVQEEVFESATIRICELERMLRYMGSQTPPDFMNDLRSLIQEYRIFLNILERENRTVHQRRRR